MRHCSQTATAFADFGRSLLLRPAKRPKHKCYREELAAQRNDAGGTHHWVSTYNVGPWLVFDKLIGTESKESEVKKMAGFAHICARTLNRGRI